MITLESFNNLLLNIKKKLLDLKFLIFVIILRFNSSGWAFGSVPDGRSDPCWMGVWIHAGWAFGSMLVKEVKEGRKSRKEGSQRRKEGSEGRK